MKIVYLEGEGVLTDDGRFYSEDQLRSLIQTVKRIVDWMNSLPEDVRAEMQRQGIENERRKAMQRGS